MEKITCSNCGRRFRESRLKCPSCGNPLEKKLLHVRPLVVIAALVIAAVLFYCRVHKNHVSHNVYIPSLVELVNMKPKDLEKMDVALVNLVCSEGLYGAENLDVKACLRQIDEWAMEIGRMLEEREFMFYQSRERYADSVNRWRCAATIYYMSKFLGIRYNSSLKNYKFKGMFDTSIYSNSRDFLIHGLVLERNRGSCSSMPVLFAAIAQRLGFPVRLARTRCHLYCMWVDPENDENFNIECTDEYAEFHPASYYCDGQIKLDPGEAGRYRYLQPLEMHDVLASFLHLRGMCLMNHGRLKEALYAFKMAARLDGNLPGHDVFIVEVENRMIYNQSNR